MKKIFIAFCMIIVSFISHANQDILIYTGPGAGPKSIQNTIATVKLLVADKYVIKTVGPDDLIDTAWMANTALLIMPGGADRPYLEKLSGIGNRNIVQYVENGGKYLGICAGAYYAADRIEFAKGDVDLEVTGVRELKFFPGLVEGPTYAGYDHRDTQNIAGMRAATITWVGDTNFKHNQEFTLFYMGGGHFVNADKYPNVMVLAKYAPEASRPYQTAAIVECIVGNGRVILSGPHFEWFADSLEGTDPTLLQIKEKIAKDESNRFELSKHLFNRLDIETKLIIAE